MIELVRIVEHQASLSSYRATQDEERALQLELLIEATKPKNVFSEWDTLVATPFRYSPPHPEARFRPAYGKNIFYGSLVAETALYEHAYYFMKERVHLKLETDTGSRTIFGVDADNSNFYNIRHEPNYKAIMDKNNFAASHQYVLSNPNVSFIIFPSCRDPKDRDNAAVLNINHLQKKIKWESAINFFYDYKQKKITWLDFKFHIRWAEVA